MEIDWFELYRQCLLSETQLSMGGAQEGAAALLQPPQPPMMLGLGGDISSRTPVMLENPEYGSAMPPLQMPGDGGVWAGSGGGLVAPGVTWEAAAEDPALMLGGGDMFVGHDHDQLMHGGGGGGSSFPELDGCTEAEGLPDCVDWREFLNGADSLWPTYQPAFDNSLLTNQQAAVVGPSSVTVCSPPPADEANYQPGSNSSGLTQVSATDSPGLTSPTGTYPHASAAVPQAAVPVPDTETTEVDQMARVAAACDDEASTVWSEEENRLFLRGLSRFADQDMVTKCLSIAFGLANKTTLDVAYRLRWLSDSEKKKKEAAKRAEPGQKISVAEKVSKGKGTKGANKKNNKCPIFEEALNSKSIDDIKRDNNRLMDRIEEILKTGQFKDIPDYFYYVKMNIDALQKKESGLATIMGGLSIDEEEWEDVLRNRSSSAGIKGHELCMRIACTDSFDPADNMK